MPRLVEYKRKYRRLYRPFTVRILTYNYKPLNSEYCTCAEGINISPNGLSFKYPRVISKNDHMRVLIEDIDGLHTEEIMANIRIVWTKTKDMLSKIYGGRFVKIPPEKKYKLIKLTKDNGGK